MIFGITDETRELVRSFYAADEEDAKGYFSYYLKKMVNPKYYSKFELWGVKEKIGSGEIVSEGEKVVQW